MGRDADEHSERAEGRGQQEHMPDTRTPTQGLLREDQPAWREPESPKDTGRLPTRDADPLGPVPPHSRQAPPEVSMSEPLSRQGCGDSREVTNVCKGWTALSSHTPSALSLTPRLFQLGHAPHSGDCPGAPCSPPRRPLRRCPEPGSPSGVRRQRAWGGRTPGSSGRGCVRSPRERQARTKGGFLHPAFHSETVSGDALCSWRSRLHGD